MDSLPAFAENFIAARSNRSFYTRSASTAGCVYVQVTRDDFILKCHWYLGWLINIMRLDLNHTIARTRIISAEKTGKPFLLYKDIVLVKFRDKAGNTQSLELYMNHADKFLRALDAPENR